MGDHQGEISLAINCRERISGPSALAHSPDSVTRPGGIVICRLANLRQVDWRRRVSPFAEASEPGGSRNVSTEMRSYTSSTVRYSVPRGAWGTTLSPVADFINARPRGDTQLM